VSGSGRLEWKLADREVTYLEEDDNSGEETKAKGKKQVQEAVKPEMKKGRKSNFDTKEEEEYEPGQRFFETMTRCRQWVHPKQSSDWGQLDQNRLPQPKLLLPQQNRHLVPNWHLLLNQQQNPGEQVGRQRSKRRQKRLL
jgi:hypothetical protein